MQVVKLMEGTEKPLSFTPLHSYQNGFEFYYTAVFYCVLGRVCCILTWRRI